jgi:hypothetical protein
LRLTVIGRVGTALSAVVEGATERVILVLACGRQRRTFAMQRGLMWVRTRRSDDSERTADEPPIAAGLVQRRERGIGAMGCRRTLVGNALEAPQWSGSNEGLLRLNHEHVVLEWRLPQHHG